MILHAIDDPGANGRTPQEGEERWTVKIPLADGDTLTIFMGRRSHDMIYGMLIAEEVEDAIASDPIGGDVVLDVPAMVEMIGGT